MSSTNCTFTLQSDQKNPAEQQVTLGLAHTNRPFRFSWKVAGVIAAEESLSRPGNPNASESEAVRGRPQQTKCGRYGRWRLLVWAAGLRTVPTLVNPPSAHPWLFLYSQSTTRCLLLKVLLNKPQLLGPCVLLLGPQTYSVTHSNPQDIAHGCLELLSALGGAYPQLPGLGVFRFVTLIGVPRISTDPD